MSAAAGSALRRLAPLFGIQASYRDIGGQRRHATSAALLATLRALGAPVERPADAPEALAAAEQARWEEPLPPVVVAWDGWLEPELRLPARLGGRVSWALDEESGGQRRWQEPLEAGAPVGRGGAAGARFVARRFPAASGLPPGYHRLVAEIGPIRAQAMVISAPRRAWTPEGDPRTWGAFAPLYALHSARSWGVGDFSDLRRLGDWLRGLGAATVGTLPLYPCFLDTPFDPSPYSPVTRLGWSELYLDVERLPELAAAPEARALVESAALREEVRALRAEPLVDARRAMRAKRQVLEAITRACAEQAPLEAFERRHPSVRDYARFRAVGERLGGLPWPRWPAPLRDGVLRDGDFDPAAERYHRMVQWLADRELAAAAGPGGGDLYLDLPVGTHAHGHETWRERDAFVPGLEVGAPPDPFFAAGQAWGFPPPHPERVRRLGYRHPIAVLRHAMARAAVLRLDHVMGLHRLFCIPAGHAATDGVYVRYRPDELYAVACLESHRARCMLVGENLGTVPPVVNRSLGRHGLAGMYVLQFEVSAEPGRAALPPPPRDALACLNTHDMAPFAGFWQAADVGVRRRLGLLDPAGAAREEALRARLRAAIADALDRHGLLDDAAAPASRVADACLRLLAQGPARLVLATLDDLWGETEAQNVPGTAAEYPNWRRRLRFALEEIETMPEVSAVLRALAAARAPTRR